MISVSEALRILGDHPLPRKRLHLPLELAVGKILLEDISADRDFPPYDRVTMDGIAIRFEDFKNGQRSFPIEATIAAGQPTYEVIGSNSCVEIMTGAVLPIGLDTVIRYEDVVIDDGKALVELPKLQINANVHAQGSDRSANAVLVHAPIKLTPAEIAIAATVGKAQLLVADLPRVLVVSTGDELVPVESIPLPHQIRSSNVHTISAALHLLGVEAAHAHLKDDADEVHDSLNRFLAEHQVIILIGGNSKGKFDYVPSTLRNLGVEELFYKVRQRPGKPFMFGVHPTGKFVFALPGNPVSSFMCLVYYFRYWLDQSLGIENAYPLAKLSQNVEFLRPLTYFLPVKIANQGSEIVAQPVEGRGSGDLANLTDADAFLILPEGQNQYEAGSAFPYISYR